MSETTFEDEYNGPANGSSGSPAPVLPARVIASNDDEIAFDQFNIPVPTTQESRTWDLPRIIEPYSRTKETVHFLDGKWKKKLIHTLWAGHPHYFSCERDGCKLCLANEATPLLATAIFARYGDNAGPAFLLIPEKDSYKYVTSTALGNMTTTFLQFRENFWTVPFEITKPDKVLFVKPELNVKKQINALTPQSPVYHEIVQIRQSVAPLEIPVFTLELNGPMFEKEAEQIKSKLGTVC